MYGGNLWANVSQHLAASYPRDGEVREDSLFSVCDDSVDTNLRPSPIATCVSSSFHCSLATMYSVLMYRKYAYALLEGIAIIVLLAGNYAYSNRLGCQF